MPSTSPSGDGTKPDKPKLGAPQQWTRSFENFNISIGHLAQEPRAAWQVGISSIQELKSIETLAKVFEQTFGIDVFDPQIQENEALSQDFPRMMLSIFNYYASQILEQEVRARSINYEKLHFMLDDLSAQVTELTKDCFGYFSNASDWEIDAYLRKRAPKKDDPDLNQTRGTLQF